MADSLGRVPLRLVAAEHVRLVADQQRHPRASAAVTRAVLVRNDEHVREERTSSR